jgi:hypothetical protein
MSSRYLNCVAVLVSVSLHLLDHRLYTKASDGLFPCVQICAKCSDKHSSEHLCFVHPIFHIWFLVTFGNEVTKILKYYIIFVCISQGKMGKTEKKRKGNHATKVTKIQKTKGQKYGMNKTLVSRTTS